MNPTSVQEQNEADLQKEVVQATAANLFELTISLKVVFFTAKIKNDFF